MNLGLIIGLIAHGSLLIHMEKDVQSIIENIFKFHKESFPSLEEFGQVTADAIDVLASGILPLDKDVAGKITESLNGVLSLIQKQAQPAA